jgi:hypothetical protein
VLFTNTGLLGVFDVLPAWKYPNGQLLHVKRTVISGWLIQHVVSATEAEGGYRVKRNKNVVESLALLLKCCYRSFS